MDLVMFRGFPHVLMEGKCAVRCGLSLEIFGCRYINSLQIEASTQYTMQYLADTNDWYDIQASGACIGHDKCYKISTS